MFLINCLVLIITYVNLVSTQSQYCGTWTEFGEQKCIHVINKESLVNYDTAIQMCLKLENSRLLTISSEIEQKIIENLLFVNMKIVDNVWIGLRRFIGWQWNDLSVIGYTNWADKSPTNNPDINCVQMSPEVFVRGKWINENCNRKAVVICQKTVDIRKIRQNALISQITKSHFLYNISKPFIDFDHKEKILFTVWSKTYNAIMKTDPMFKVCESLNSHMLEIRSKAKQDMVTTLVEQWLTGKNDFFWLNAMRDTWGKWRWNSDNTEFVYTNWMANQPENKVNYDYAFMRHYSASKISYWISYVAPNTVANVVCEYVLH